MLIYSKGNVVTVYIDEIQNLVEKTSNLIYTLPEEQIPMHKCYVDTVSTDLSEFYRFTISTDGTIRCYPYQGVSKQSTVAVSINFIRN